MYTTLAESLFSGAFPSHLGFICPQPYLATLQPGIPDTSHLPIAALVKINYTILLSNCSSDLEDS